MFWTSENLRKEDQIRANIQRHQKALEKERNRLSALYDKVYKSQKAN